MAQKVGEQTGITFATAQAPAGGMVLRTIDNDLALAIKSLLDGQPRGTTICPSEAARLVARDDGSDLDGWRYLMEPTRSAARRLVAEGRLEIVQRGKVVDPSTAKGPIRLRRRSAP